MKYLTVIKDTLKDQIALASQLLLLVLAAYVFTMAEEHRRWKTPVLFIGLLSWFFLRHRIKHPIIWITLFVLLAVDLYFKYFWVANHHFMLIFMVLSVLIYSYHKRTDILLKNIQILLVIVVLTSVVQKLMSTQFMSGDFYYYMSNRGVLFRNFINFFPEKLEIIKSNSKNLFDLHATDPNIGEHIVLKNILPNLGLISVVFAWVTVVMELVVAIALLFKPRSVWTHLFFAAMILGILCTRFETGFMALLAICGLYLCRNLYLQLLYVLIVIGCFILILTKLGFH
ncbi:hypothetical protein [Gelidibacter gilvus]|uniref:Uncharacterized protein n=1 Tax=Gelidibacter gilvus TaxID=59602 RepID=A0A4Q0XGV5_9FLAO|nr:hypothetical protein [Gelidibacter gilvus]RXJ45986.1 hypothetical protein ESZ48_14345 [Gelidibacter gilvus]